MPSETVNQIDLIQRLLTREIWVITSATPVARGGLLATWFHSVSIDPERPMVLAAIGASHFTRQLIDQSGAWVAHLMASDQAELAVRFALTSGASHDKLSGLSLRPSPRGLPVLEDCLAWMECRVIRRLETPDRIYYWAVPEAGERREASLAPLTDRELFAAIAPQQRQALLAGLARDIAAGRSTEQAPWKISEVN